MKKGFTLIELLVFIAIFTLIIGSFIAILVSVINIQTRQVAISEIEQQGQFLTQQIQYYVQSARLVDMPVDTPMTTLTLRQSTSSSISTVFSVSSGTMYLTQANGRTSQALTSNKVTITNVSFTRHYNLSSSSAYGSDSVSYSFTVVAGNYSIVSSGSSTSTSTYSYSRSITVSSNASGTNTNFPMLFSGTYSWLAASSSAGRIQNLTTAPNGGQEPADLIFTSDSGCTTPLNFETESYTSSTGAINDWINVSSLSAGTVIYACYGASSVTTDQSHPSSTWNSNYQLVVHLASPTSTLSVIDSTGQNVGTNNGSTATTGGQIDGGGSFNGTSQYISLTNSEPTLSSFTASIWVYPGFSSTDTGNHEVLTRQNGGGDTARAARLTWNGSNGWVSDSMAAYAYNATPTFSANTWHLLTFTMTGSNNGGQFYWDGGAISTTQLAYSTGPNNTTRIPYYIGSEATPAYYFPGSLDEAEVSNVVLSPSWILTEYNNQSSPSTFYTVGSESTNQSLNLTQLSSELFQSSITVPAPVPKIALIQQEKGENNGASVSSIATSYASNNEAGDLLIAVVANKGSATSSITDSQGNTWNLVASTTYSSYTEVLSVYAALNAKAGANTVTTSFGSGASYASVFLYEYRGAATVASVDKWAGQVQAATSTPSSGFVNPTSTAELLLGIDYNANTTEVPSPVAGYILETSSTVNNTTQVFVEYQDQYISGSVSAGWNYTGTPDSTAMIVTFK